MVGEGGVVARGRVAAGEHPVVDRPRRLEVAPAHRLAPGRLRVLETVQRRRLSEIAMSHMFRRNVVHDLGVAPNRAGASPMPTLLQESAFVRRLRAMLEFLRSETAGGAILIVSGIIALIWANSRAGGAYEALLDLRLGPQTLHIWVNDGLMAIFFLLVGFELRREMTSGQLASASRVAAPALAALGGMIAPAVIFS